MSHPDPSSYMLKVVLGSPTPVFMEEGLDLELGRKFLDAFGKHGDEYNQIDTANAYMASEKNFGLLKAAEQGWAIDTKVRSFEPGAHTADSLIASVKQSLSMLGTSQIHILYLHAPDPATPFEDTLRALDAIHKEGKFEKLGLSNYSAENVKQICEIADKHGWVRPTVYQGVYNILCRKVEGELLPLLKKEGIAFYAYSPLAAGLLTGRWTKKEDINEGSHFSHAVVGPIFTHAFGVYDSFYEVMPEYVAEARKHNISPAEVALRWMAYHSPLSKDRGDAIILGASKPEQFDTSIEGLKRGPLPSDLVALIDKIWDKVKEQSPPYHY
eukprot:TRINITY_DN17207_c0_g1_i1.p1 TRINITY_DN17207_c0_g1~~TRINITY_DN17207_c0_g1_i1.p1  ORF type:complete len:339 (+),score=80.73 TRINITY_DN17207_c0_g1_i1:39-1019(+)